MIDAVVLAYLGAGLIAIGSSVFGVGLARVLWAQDLKWAQEIDAIRSQTEGHLRSQIKSLEDQLAIRR